MKISLEWIADFVEVRSEVSALDRGMTMGGIEVEGISTTGADFKQVVAAEILSFQQHPNADRLSVCKVNDGSEVRQIVCGAKNFKAGDRILLALPGAVLPGDFKIKESKLRGELSQGMMCSSKELNLPGDDSGLLILDPSTTLGTPVKSLYPANTVFDLEITPNRPDLLSHEGMAREWVFLGLGSPKTRAAAPALGTLPQGLAVSVEDSELCPLYTATVFEGVRVGPSPSWLAQRLEAVGLRPINNVVDITNFVLMEMGQPMHAFDAGKIQGGLSVRRAQAGEKIAALNGKEYTLNSSEAVIADGSGPLAIAGVIGGEPSSVVADTTTIVLEVARFHPPSVRSASRGLGVVTDSSYRFERGVDPELCLRARDRAAQLLQELCGATPKAATLCGSPEVLPRTVSVRVSRAASVLSLPLTAERVIASLEKCGCKNSSTSGDLLEFSIPSWRGDLVREADLIEEIIRAEGLEKVPSRRSFEPSPLSAVDARYARFRTLKDKLAALGFFEIVTVPFEAATGGVALRNPMTEDQKFLRDSLLPRLLRAAADNIHQGNKSLRLFELGKTYKPEGEKWVLGCLVSGPVSAPHWSHSDERPADLFDLKGVFDALGLHGVTARAATRSELKDLGIKQPVTVAEFVLDDQPETARVFVPWSSYPTAERDVALVVDRTLPAGRVLEAIHQFKPEAAASVTLFDLFSDESGEKLPADKKSLAFSLRYCSAERTMTDDEVNKLHESLKAALKSELGCSFRE